MAYAHKGALPPQVLKEVIGQFIGLEPGVKVEGLAAGGDMYIKDLLAGPKGDTRHLTGGVVIGDGLVLQPPQLYDVAAVEDGVPELDEGAEDSLVRHAFHGFIAQVGEGVEEDLLADTGGYVVLMGPLGGEGQKQAPDRVDAYAGALRHLVDKRGYKADVEVVLIEELDSAVHGRRVQLVRVPVIGSFCLVGKAGAVH